MRTRSPVLLWLLLLLACFHAAAGAVRHAHGGGPGSGLVAVAHAASDKMPVDPAPDGAHVACNACLLQAHGALPAVTMPTIWEPVALPAAPLHWAAREDAPQPAPWRARFAARDPPAAG
ncbi:hypothetical protein [Xylophilus ampelinus]|uniref:DUF2946 family protein n=1 Tax=Xylophilus ampelinus TaxID=54067 RepID=A0A318SJA1_9BURK|nr:hypothetical protein [Xylophilus ampelinus]MCS4509354.1 hypothetical protein [Xylophilus ampelinus]PYE79076.1 hypothetical protein DFQ15_10363 [Xylophilus ampelinus]